MKPSILINNTEDSHQTDLSSFTKQSMQRYLHSKIPTNNQFDNVFIRTQPNRTPMSSKKSVNFAELDSGTHGNQGSGDYLEYTLGRQAFRPQTPNQLNSMSGM